MNNIYFEKKSIRLDELFKRKDLNNFRFIIFDTETTGLHKYSYGSRNNTIKKQLPPEIRKELIKYYINNYNKSDEKAMINYSNFINKLRHSEESDKISYNVKQRWAEKQVKLIEDQIQEEVQIAEIAVIVTDSEGNEIDKFHEYIKFRKKNLLKEVFDFIHWDQNKENNAKKIRTVLIKLSSFLSKYKENSVLIAHNAPFDASLLVRTAKKYQINELVDFIKNKTIVDSKATTKLRQLIPSGTLPYKEINAGKGGKRIIEDNKQISFQKALNILNNEQHTALEDVKALKSIIFKLLSIYNNK